MHMHEVTVVFLPAEQIPSVEYCEEGIFVVDIHPVVWIFCIRSDSGDSDDPSKLISFAFPPFSSISPAYLGFIAPTLLPPIHQALIVPSY